jgi:hypothetical protein
VTVRFWTITHPRRRVGYPKPADTELSPCSIHGQRTKSGRTAARRERRDVVHDSRSFCRHSLVDSSLARASRALRVGRSRRDGSAPRAPPSSTCGSCAVSCPGAACPGPCARDPLGDLIRRFASP